MSAARKNDSLEKREASIGPSRRIILVEDNYAVADGLKWALEVEGHAVVGMAATVKTAFALLETTSYDFAILDIDLRGESIVEVARVISARSIPFMFITGFGDTVDLPADLANAPRLNKPADPREILAMIGAACTART